MNCEKTYGRGTLGKEELAAEINVLWHAIQDDEELRQDAIKAGIDLNEIGRAEGAELNVVDGKEAGVDVASLLIVIGGTTVSTVAAHYIIRLIDEVFVPWIRARRGEDAVKDATKDEADRRVKH